MRVGAHLRCGLRTAVETAKDVGADCAQLFISNPRAWSGPRLDTAEKFGASWREGDIGPPIAGNGTLTNRQGLIRLLSTGQNTDQFESYMPAVGLGWTGRQYDALIAYIKATPKLREAGAASGG